MPYFSKILLWRKSPINPAWKLSFAEPPHFLICELSFAACATSADFAGSPRKNHLAWSYLEDPTPFFMWCPSDQTTYDSWDHPGIRDQWLSKTRLTGALLSFSARKHASSSPWRWSASRPCVRPPRSGTWRPAHWGGFSAAPRQPAKS